MSDAAAYVYPGCGHTQMLKKRNRDRKPEACNDCILGRRTFPTIWQAATAAEHHGVLRLHVEGRAQGHWAAGWLYWLTGRAMRAHPAAAADTDALRGWLETSLRNWRLVTTAQTTECLTRAVKDAAFATPDARAYRELRLPVVTSGAARYGRLDVVIWQPHLPDIAIEIDSAPNPGSARKLEFARDAGAVAIWVRHGSGGIDAPEGVNVIDLRA